MKSYLLLLALMFVVGSVGLSPATVSAAESLAAKVSIQTIPLNQATAEQLQELPVEQATHVQWELNLQTKVQMPKFIQALPQSLVKASGDRLLNQIVKQISKRLTRKVQEDFHTMMNLPLPGRTRRR